jgi:cobalamin biosynthesis Mg chelatase CobN
MACFPALAVADENSGVQYDVDPVPAVPGNGDDVPSKKNSGGSDPSDESADESSEATGSNTPGGAGSGGDGSDTGGSGSGQGTQGSGGDDAQRADGSQSAGGDIAKAQALKTTSSPVDASSDDGSSPLVPILIAVAVLAAISIGAFYYRQRRQGPGSTVSPNAN